MIYWQVEKMEIDIVDRFLSGNISSENARQLFISLTGFTISEILDNAEETLNTLHDTILSMPNNQSNNQYILQCIILSTFLTKDDDRCATQLMTICHSFSYYSNLKHLRIIDCDITDAMLQNICKHFSNTMHTKCRLELIDISYNLISNHGIQILSETLILFHCKTMRNIMCAANYITDVGLVSLSKVVVLCEYLEFIDVSQQQSEQDDRSFAPITNCLPLLSALINKQHLKGIELFHCGIMPHLHCNDQELNQIFKTLLCSTPQLGVLQLGRTNLNHPIILQHLFDAIIMRGKWILKTYCETQLLPIFESCCVAQHITLDIIQIIKLYIFDFYDDKFHLVLSQNSFDAETIVPVLLNAFSNPYCCVGRVDLTGNMFTFEDIAEIGKVIINNPKMHSISFDVKGYANGDKITWNWADKMRAITKDIYFVKGSSKDAHRGGYVRSDHSKIYWSTVAHRQTHVCDSTRGTVYD
eukprot:866925_1